MGYKVVVISRSFGSTSNEPMEILKEHDCDVVTLDAASCTDEELIEALADADGLIIGGRTLPERIIRAAPRLRVINMHGVGVDHIDIAAATAQGIAVTNCPKANTDGVADLTFALMLAVARPIISASEAVKRGEWGRHPGVEIWQKTLGLLGLGSIGSAVVRRAAGFDMKVLVRDPFVPDDVVREMGAIPVTFDELLTQSDFVTLHAPLTEETRSIIDASALSKMKQTAYLINTARGELIDEQALMTALIDGEIAGAGLDVLVEEPPSDFELVNLPNVVATPHMGSHSIEAITNASVMSAKNTVLVLSNERPLSRVN